jgi:hypothetical protein
MLLDNWRWMEPGAVGHLPMNPVCGAKWPPLSAAHQVPQASTRCGHGLGTIGKDRSKLAKDEGGARGGGTRGGARPLWGTSGMLGKLLWIGYSDPCNDAPALTTAHTCKAKLE